MNFTFHRVTRDHMDHLAQKVEEGTQDFKEAEDFVATMYVIKTNFLYDNQIYIYNFIVSVCKQKSVCFPVTQKLSVMASPSTDSESARFN